MYVFWLMENNILRARDFVNMKVMKVSREETNIKHLSPKLHLLKFQCIEHAFLKRGVENK